MTEPMHLSEPEIQQLLNAVLRLALFRQMVTDGPLPPQPDRVRRALETRLDDLQLTGASRDHVRMLVLDAATRLGVPGLETLEEPTCG